MKQHILTISTLSLAKSRWTVLEHFIWSNTPCHQRFLLLILIQDYDCIFPSTRETYLISLPITTRLLAQTTIPRPIKQKRSTKDFSGLTESMTIWLLPIMIAWTLGRITFQ